MFRTTALLLACFILAQADKQVMGLLAIPIQRSFDLSNTALGFLQGGAFAIAFAVGGMPIARLIDAGHRLRLAGWCVALWSIATILCGLSPSFAILLAFRAMTAVAEAGLPPAAFSIFSQNRDRRLVTLMTGTFMLAPFVGGGLMLMLGGWLLQAAAGGLATSTGMEPWRLVLLCVGLPGLLLAPLLPWLGREPERKTQPDPATALSGFRTVFVHIFGENRFLRHYYAALTAFYAATAALMAWYPALLVRSLGLPIGSAGAHAGITYLVGGVSGTLLATAFFSSRRDVSPATITRVFLLVAMLLVPVVALLPLMTSLPASLALYGLFAFLSAGVLAIMPVPVQLSLADRLRARGTAILSLSMSALAGTMGPLFVGMFMDVSGRPLSIALSAVTLLSSVLSVWHFSRAMRAA